MFFGGFWGWGWGGTRSAATGRIEQQLHRPVKGGNVDDVGGVGGDVHRDGEGGEGGRCGGQRPPPPWSGAQPMPSALTPCSPRSGHSHRGRWARRRGADRSGGRRPCRGAATGSPRQERNANMAPVRIPAEWHFGNQAGKVKLVGKLGRNQVLSQPVETFLAVANFVHNCFVCLHGSQTETYFAVPGPSLEQYCGVASRHDQPAAPDDPGPSESDDPGSGSEESAGTDLEIQGGVTLRWAAFGMQLT